jgi:hypothetical protein
MVARFWRAKVEHDEDAATFRTTCGTWRSSATPATEDLALRARTAPSALQAKTCSRQNGASIG